MRKVMSPRTPGHNPRSGFSLLFVFILCVALAGLLTVLSMQTLITLDATDAADESLRQSLPNAGASP